MPVANMRHVVAMFVDVELVLDELVAQPLLLVTGDAVKLWNTVEHIACEMEPVEIVQHRHVERSGCGSFLLVPADVQVVVIRAPVGQSVNEPRIPMESEYDGLISRED